MRKASQVFYKLHGVKTIDVHLATCGPRQALPTWKRLESSLLDTFRKTYFELPKYNKIRPKATEGIFSDKALQKIIARFEPK